MLLSLVCVCALASVPSQTPPAAKAPGAPVQAPLNLTEPIAAATRWLRTKQDPVDGSYAKSIDVTALVLRAFAECPDHFRSASGPFVAKAAEWLVSKQQSDGSIAVADANKAAKDASTRVSAEALFALGDAQYKAQLGKALAYLGTTDLQPSLVGPEDDESAIEYAARAEQILARQLAPGQWGKDAPDIATTAAMVLDLSATDRLLKLRAAAAQTAKPIEKLPAFTATDRASALKALEKGCDFLAQISDNGKWGEPGKPNLGLTAMALAGLQTRPTPRPEAQQKLIDAGLAWIASMQKPDGSIHDGKLANYMTSASVMALARSGDAKWLPVIEKARGYLIALQADEGDGYSEGDMYYGGIGYEDGERPDMSNLVMALEALSASKLDPNAPTYKKALKFLERCQNRSESNDTKIVNGKSTITSGNDGGGFYAPGESKGGFIDLGNGKKAPRSYGSMTYALLKCMIFAGVPKDDPRFVAAFDWCKKNYTLDVNPGFDVSADPAAPYQGLFYYLNTMAKTLDLMGLESVNDNTGAAHAWRQEICGRVVSMQSKIDGSWINHNSPRWYEGNPLLGTAYALLTLDAAMPRAK
jgi:squalene-hopene/tetraprenyl-beta-curcumene cyclase